MKFSIITGTYNQQQLLEKLFEALKRQTVKDFEWIVCDDGSNDGTREYIQGLTADFPIKYVRNIKIIKRSHYAKAINKGIKKAVGDYCIFISGDSFPEVNFLEQINEYVSEDTVVCGVRIQIDHGQAVDIDWRLKKYSIPSEPRILPSEPYARVTGNGIAIPRKAFDEVGLWDESFVGYGGEDNDLFVKLYFNGYIFWSVPEAIIYHHWHKTKGSEHVSKVAKTVKYFLYERA